MPDVKVMETATDRVRVEFRADVDPGDEVACLALLRRTVTAQRLGSPGDFRIQVWDQRRGWQEYRT